MKRSSGELSPSTVALCPVRWLLTNRTRYPPTDEVFFVQNAGAPAAGTGLHKSSIIQKISLADAEAVRKSAKENDEVKVTVVPSHPQVINPNGKRLAN